MAQRLQGKTALITGSTSNIGRAIALAFGAEGAHVVVSGRDDARGAAVAARIRDAGGAADYVRADLDGSPAASRALAAAATDRLGGRLDILVNNAGVFPAATTLTADGDMFDRVYGVNVKAPFFLTQAAAATMIAAGGGAIINLGSWVARLSVPPGALYASTKGAMETLTRAWAAEFGPRGIRVNAVSPGVIADPDRYPDGGHPAAVMMTGTPAGRAGPSRRRRGGGRVPRFRRRRIRARHGPRRGWRAHRRGRDRRARVTARPRARPGAQNGRAWTASVTMRPGMKPTVKLSCWKPAGPARAVPARLSRHRSHLAVPAAGTGGGRLPGRRPVHARLRADGHP